jgi:hypothetical protein
MSDLFDSLINQHKNKNGYGYGGLGGSIKEPSNSLYSANVVQYDDDDKKFEFPKNYKNKQPITDKTNNFINKFVGKNVDVYYILDTKYRKEIRIVRVLYTFKKGDRYFFKLKTKRTIKIH